MDKKHKLIILTIILIIIAVVLYTMPREIEESYTGYLYTSDNRVAELTDIKVKGKLYPKIFSDNYFDGEISFDNKVLPLRSGISGTMKVALKSMKDKLLKKSMLLSIIKYDNGYVNTYGGVWVSRDFSTIWGNIKNLNEKYKDISLMFAAPATNEEEAEIIGSSFVSEY